MIDRDQVIKRINERLAMTTPWNRFAKEEHDAPFVHAMVAVLLEVVHEEVSEQIKHLQDQLDVIRPRVM